MKSGLIGFKSSPIEPIGSEKERNLVGVSQKMLFPHEGNGNDDISSEEHFENSKTIKGTYLDL